MKFLDRVQTNSGANYGYTDPAGARRHHGHRPVVPHVPGLEEGQPGPGQAACSGSATAARRRTTCTTTTTPRRSCATGRASSGGKWNSVMRDQLVDVAGQGRGTRRAVGSCPAATTAPGRGGRLYFTALAAMTLEVYYRYLPLYRTRERRGGGGEVIALPSLAGRRARCTGERIGVRCYVHSRHSRGSPPCRAFRAFVGSFSLPAAVSRLGSHRGGRAADAQARGQPADARDIPAAGRPGRATLSERGAGRVVPPLDRQGTRRLRLHFLEDWSPGDQNDKTIVFQSRMTWVCAQVAMRYPDLKTQYLGYTRHGVDFLDRAMWDAQGRPSSGDWTRRASSGQARAARSTLYGIAFGIYGLAAALRGDRTTRRPWTWQADLCVARPARPRRRPTAATTRPWPATAGRSLALTGGPARAADDATDRHALRLQVDEQPHPPARGAHGALPGLAGRAVEKRLREVFPVVRDKIAVEPGCLNLYFTPDWRAVPDHDSFGHDVETAYLLLEAAEARRARRRRGRWPWRGAWSITRWRGAGTSGWAASTTRARPSPRPGAARRSGGRRPRGSTALLLDARAVRRPDARAISRRS